MKKLTDEMLASVDGLPAREAGRRLGVGKSTINDARARRRGYGAKQVADSQKFRPSAPRSASIEQKSDGSLIVQTTDDVPQTKANIDDRMRARGFDPDKYSFSYGFSEWEAQVGGGQTKTLYSARASAVEKNVKGAKVPTIEADGIFEMIERYEPVTMEVADHEADDTFVFNFADPQLGKTDINGGTKGTVDRFMASLDHACHLLETQPTRQIIWADLGDGIENFCNTSSQRQTNDLNLVEQVRVLRRLQVQGLLRLSAYAPITHVSVPSNHSMNRVGFQQPASTSHDDWGLEVQQQIIEAFQMASEKLPHDIDFVWPDDHMESVSITTPDGTTLGFVHGHRSNSQKALDTWWAGQSLGRQPTADADILLVGHFHNYGIQSVGAERYIVTTPSLDPGSSWFTVSRGHVATAGVLALRVRNKRITFSEII